MLVVTHHAARLRWPSVAGSVVSRFDAGARSRDLLVGNLLNTATLRIGERPIGVGLVGRRVGTGPRAAAEVLFEVPKSCFWWPLRPASDQRPGCSTTAPAAAQLERVAAGWTPGTTRRPLEPVGRSGPEVAAFSCCRFMCTTSLALCSAACCAWASCLAFVTRTPSTWLLFGGRVSM